MQTKSTEELNHEIKFATDIEDFPAFGLHLSDMEAQALLKISKIQCAAVRAWFSVSGSFGSVIPFFPGCSGGAGRRNPTEEQGSY